MGSKSKSSTSTTQQTFNTQDIDTTTVGLEEIGEDAIALGQVGGDVQVTQISTDAGSLEVGRRIGEASLDFAGEFGDSAFDFGDDALSTVERGLDSSLDFASGVSSDAFSTVGDTVKGGFGLASDAFSAISNTVSDSLKATTQTTQATVSELGRAIDKAGNATRSDTTQSFQKIILYVSIAGAVAILGYALIRRYA